MEDKNLQLDRLVFFSDAVVAIAITLLALDLRLPRPAPAHLHLADILAQWRTFAAFLLSFLNIAQFWKTHHNFLCPHPAHRRAAAVAQYRLAALYHPAAFYHYASQRVFFR